MTDNCLFFKVWRNVYLQKTIFNKLKESKSIEGFPTRYSYYQINNFQRLIKHNKILLVDKVKRCEIIDFNDFNDSSKHNQVLFANWDERGNDLHGLLFKNYNKEEDTEFYINLFKNYSLYFPLVEEHQIEYMVTTAVKFDCAVVLKVLADQNKYVVNNDDTTLFKSAIKYGSIKVLEYLKSRVNVGLTISNKVWDTLYHFGNEYTCVKSVDQNISTAKYLVKNYEAFGLNKPSGEMKKQPPLLLILKKLSLEQLFDLCIVLSFNNHINLPSVGYFEQQKSNFTTKELTTTIQDLQSTNIIIGEMVSQIQPFTGDKSKENLIFYEIKFNRGNGSKINSLLTSVPVLLLSTEVFSLGDFKLLEQLDPVNESKSFNQHVDPLDLFRYCPNDTDRHIQFIKDSFTYSYQNPCENHSVLTLPNLFLVFVSYSNVSYVKFIIDLLNGYGAKFDTYLNHGIFEHIKHTEMFDVVYDQIKDTMFFNFTHLIDRVDVEILKHFKSKYPLEYQNQINKISINFFGFQFHRPALSKGAKFVYENIDDFELIIRNYRQTNSNLTSNETISGFPLSTFIKMLKIQTTKKFTITSMEIIEWILVSKDNSEMDLASHAKYSISNNTILKYHYFEDGNLLNSNLISIINKCDTLVKLVDLLESIVLLIVERGDLHSLIFLIDQTIIDQSSDLLPDIQLYIKDQIIFYIIKTNRLELLLFISKNYQNQFDLTSQKYVNYFANFKSQTEVTLFISNEINTKL